MRGLALKSGRFGLVDDLGPPPVGAGEVEVEVVCASVNPTDLELAAGIHDAMLAQAGGLDATRTGLEFSGIVKSAGQRFAGGEAVFGYVDLVHGPYAHQERIAIGEDLIALKPTTWSFAQAAAVPLGAQTSLVALRDVAAAKPSERVLVHGASGGLGVYAVQIASRMLGLHVTAVAGPDQQAFLEGLGAHEVLDYTSERVGERGQTYDIVFDLTARMQFDEAEVLLTPQGRFMPSEPLKAGVDFSEGSRSGQRSVNLWVAKGDGEVLTEIAQWVSQGRLEMFVDSVYPFEDFQRAFDRVEQRGKRGRVVMALDPKAGQR